MCVKLADLTTHSPAEDLRSPPHSDTPSPSTSDRPRNADARPQAVRCIPRSPHNPFPAEDLRSPTHSDTPFPYTPAPPRSPDARPRSPDARPQAVRCIPRSPHNPFPAEDLRSPTQPRRMPAVRDAFPADLTTHSPPKTFAPPRSPDACPQAARCTPADRTTHSPHSVTLPPLPFRFGHKKTAPHSACAMPNVSVDRRCGRSFGLVSRALFAAVAGRWRVGMGLRLQPWALRSRRCGRVLRA